MKMNILQKATRLAGMACAVEMAVAHGNVRALVTARQLLARLDKQILYVLSAISLREAKFNLPKLGHSVYEREQKENPYRCWACFYMGTNLICENIWLDRKACMLFKFNGVLRHNKDRLKKLTKGNRKLPRLKLPEIKTYNKHIEKCRYCQRIWASEKLADKGERVVKMVTHYRRYKIRRQRKRMVFFAYYGISYRGDYVSGWED